MTRPHAPNRLTRPGPSATRRATLRLRVAASLAAGLTGAAAAADAPATPASVVDCVIEAHQSVDLRWPADGAVAQVQVRRGDRVSVGQTLAQLDSKVEEAALNVSRQRAAMEGRENLASHRLEQARRKLARVEALNRENYASTQAVEEAQAEARMAEADWQDARENRELARKEVEHASQQLARRVLRSPMDGVVVERYVNPGDLAEANGRRPAFRLAQVDPLRVEAVLPVAWWGKVRAGQWLTVIPEGSTARLTARVSVVDSLFDSASGTFGVRASLSGPKLPPAGVRCKLELPVKVGQTGATPPGTPNA